MTQIQAIDAAHDQAEALGVAVAVWQHVGDAKHPAQGRFIPRPNDEPAPKSGWAKFADVQPNGTVDLVEPVNAPAAVAAVDAGVRPKKGADVVVQTVPGEVGPRGPAGPVGPVGPAADVGACWPVGSVFIGVVPTNPSVLLGVGVWAALASGRMLVGVDVAQPEFDTVEKTGGAKTHALTVAEMPAHTHVQDAHSHVQRIINSGTAGTVGTQGASAASNANASNSPTAVTTATNQNTGGGGAHNNLPPYLAVYMWKRTG